jgi:hypothetical protein
VRTRPFLSHKREDRNSVIALKRVLATYGVGGWRDLDDLHLGELNQPGFEHAINDVTGGCLWYGTKRVLRSWYVNNVELPAAVARKRRQSIYPLVPLFATVSPSQAKRALLKATKESGAKLSEDDIDVFMDANGCKREGEQRIADFRVDIARRYVRAAANWLDQDTYSVAITALTRADRHPGLHLRLAPPHRPARPHPRSGHLVAQLDLLVAPRRRASARLPLRAPRAPTRAVRPLTPLQPFRFQPFQPGSRNRRTGASQARGRGHGNHRDRWSNAAARRTARRGRDGQPLASYFPRIK